MRQLPCHVSRAREHVCVHAPAGPRVTAIRRFVATIGPCLRPGPTAYLPMSCHHNHLQANCSWRSSLAGVPPDISPPSDTAVLGRLRALPGHPGGGSELRSEVWGRRSGRASVRRADHEGRRSPRRRGRTGDPVGPPLRGSHTPGVERGGAWFVSGGSGDTAGEHPGHSKNASWGLPGPFPYIL